MPFEKVDVMAKQAVTPVRSGLIVVVDDDDAVRKSLKFSLELEGFVVRTYARAEQLLNESALANCHCLIVDEKLPGMNGLDLIAALRERRIAAPVILITTHPNPALKRRAASFGIPIVEKPLLSGALFECIDAATSPPVKTLQ